MDKPEPSVDELEDSVIHAGTELKYRIVRDDTGRLQITADRESPLEPPLAFEMSDEELLAYYDRLAADAGRPGGADTPWKTWLLLMSTHLEEAAYQAGILDRPCVIVIGRTGFGPEPR